MNFESIDILSNEKIIEKYNSILNNSERDIISNTNVYWINHCANGKRGYYYEYCWADYKSPGYCGYVCGYYSVLSVCKSGCAYQCVSSISYC